MHRLTLLLGLVVFSSSWAATPLFEDDAVLDVTLRGPLSAVFQDTEQRRERNFSLGVGDAEFDIRARLRGKSRVVRCKFPPLRLNFSSSETVDSVFAGQDKLKLVSHCKSGDKFERNVLEEYAAYRIMNLLSDISFRVRLLRIRYVDTDNPGVEPIVRYGFVIESDAGLAARLNGEVLHVEYVTRTMLDVQHSALVYVFQYLIGNTDWSLVPATDEKYCCHNGKLASIGERRFYVPYDFDMAGLVNASYAKPHSDVRIRSVRVRRYRGYCTDTGALTNALRAVVGQREQIMQIVERLPDASSKERNARKRYLEAFFELASDEDKLLRDFERRCL